MIKTGINLNKGSPSNMKTINSGMVATGSQFNTLKNGFQIDLSFLSNICMANIINIIKTNNINKTNQYEII